MSNQIVKESAQPPGYPELDSDFRGSFRRHFGVDVTSTHADILLLTCCFISGLVDSTIYHAYGTFVSMQTVTSSFFSATNNDKNHAEDLLRATQ